MTPEKLELILRHYSEFVEIWQTTQREEFMIPDGDGPSIPLNIHDLDREMRRLPMRQRTALVLTCVYNHREVDVHRMMGLKGRRSSPVGAYKKIALRKLCERLWGADEAGGEDGDPGA